MRSQLATRCRGPRRTRELATFASLYKFYDPDTCCEGFGPAVDGAGDFDRDGVPDLVVGDILDRALFFFSGAVHVYSGADGSEIALCNGSHADEDLGYMVAGLRNVDGDGFDDVGATAQGGNRVRIYGGGMAG